jgi:hypothetical protein
VGTRSEWSRLGLGGCLVDKRKGAARGRAMERFARTPTDLDSGDHTISLTADSLAVQEYYMPLVPPPRVRRARQPRTTDQQEDSGAAGAVIAYVLASFARAAPATETSFLSGLPRRRGLALAKPARITRCLSFLSGGLHTAPMDRERHTQTQSPTHNQHQEHASPQACQRTPGSPPSFASISRRVSVHSPVQSHSSSDRSLH